MLKSQSKTFFLKRIILSSIFLISAFILPWWLVMFLGLMLLFYFNNYYEFIIAGLILDSLYGNIISINHNKMEQDFLSIKRIVTSSQSKKSSLLASHFYKSKDSIITISAFQFKENEYYLQLSIFDTEKNERVENRLQLGIKEFIVSTITSSGEEILLASKDGRVIKVDENLIRDHKKWESMIDGYNKWLGSQPTGLL